MILINGQWQSGVVEGDFLVGREVGGGGGEVGGGGISLLANIL